MNISICKIYNRRKYIGSIPFKLVKKSEFSYEHLILRDSYTIKPGYLLILNNREKLYVTDVRTHHLSTHKLEIYYETELTHKRKLFADVKANLSLLIAFAALVVSVIALFKT